MKAKFHKQNKSASARGEVVTTMARLISAFEFLGTTAFLATIIAISTAAGSTAHGATFSYHNAEKTFANLAAPTVSDIDQEWHLVGIARKPAFKGLPEDNANVNGIVRDGFPLLHLIFTTNESEFLKGTTVEIFNMGKLQDGRRVDAGPFDVNFTKNAAEFEIPAFENSHDLVSDKTFWATDRSHWEVECRKIDPFKLICAVSLEKGSAFTPKKPATQTPTAASAPKLNPGSNSITAAPGSAASATGAAKKTKTPVAAIDGDFDIPAMPGPNSGAAAPQPNMGDGNQLGGEPANEPALPKKNVLFYLAYSQHPQ